MQCLVRLASQLELVDGLCRSASVKTACMNFEARMGALCLPGPLDALDEQEKAVSW